MGKRKLRKLMRENWKNKKSCKENTIHPGRYTDSIKGSTYSDSSTRKSGKRTQQTNRPKTYYKFGKVF